MKNLKIFALVCALGMLYTNCFAVTAFAQETDTPGRMETPGDEPNAGGLISSYSLYITASVKAINITAYTYGTATMAEIGFTNIEIQHSSNGVSGWTAETFPIDDVATYTNYHAKSGESKNVFGGYYYRVVLDHHAKETGIFPQTQDETNYSNVVWVPKK